MIEVGYHEKKKLISFMEDINDDFVPKLTDKVRLDNYVDKIIDKAILLVDLDGDNIAGLVVLYCNDQSQRRAYIPFCGVKKEYRNLGIARRLIEKAITITGEKQFKVLGIHSNNLIAINLYRKLGFHLVEADERSYLEHYL